MILNMVVAAQGYDGPDFFFCKVNCTEEQYEDGVHYEVAKEAASDHGFEGPMVPIDPNDPAGRVLADKFVWDSASTFSR